MEGELKGSVAEVAGQGSRCLLTNPSLWCSLWLEGRGFL